MITKQSRKKMSLAAKARCTAEWRRKKSEAYATKLPKRRVASMYRSGMTQKEIADALGVTQKVVWGFMKRNGMKARAAVKREQKGPNNSNWKGAQAGYQAMHLRLSREYGTPKRCDECGTTDKRKSYDWANLTGNYHDMSDYRRLCRSCHWKRDNKIFNIKHMRERMAARG